MMAVNRSAQAALTIALSIFVMLTFALGVTTYLYFTKSLDMEQGLEDARSQLVKAEETTQRTAADMNRLREIIGVPADVLVDEIDTQLNALVAGDFAGFPSDTATYVTLLQWLRQEFRQRNTDVKTAEEDKKAMAAQKAAEVAAAEKAKDEATRAAQKAQQESAAAAADFSKRWEGHEQEQKTLLAARKAAEDRARDLESLKADIATGLDYVSPGRKTAYNDAINAGDSGRQLDQLRGELLARAKEIARLNSLLTRLRVADPDLQEAIAAARPADDRIEGFNGHVVNVDPRTGTALVSCRTTAGLRPGLVLHVFRPDDPRPEFASRKGVVEITDIEGPTLLRATIRREDSRNPILSGDGVSSSLWAGGVNPEIVIVGFVDVDADGRSDMEALKSLVEQAGGRIVDAVAPNTAVLVDLGQPAAGEDGREVPGWSVESKRRKVNLDGARTYNIRVTGVDGLLDMLGLDPESFSPGRLPKARAVGRLPARR